MTPAETLAAARSNVVGPYIPATEALLAGWVGPINIAREAGDPSSAYLYGVWLSNAAQIIGERIGYGVGDEYGNPDDVRIFLDLRRPEVQDHLVRRGAPEWARRLPAALWVWATGVEVVKAFPLWKQQDTRRQDFGRVGANDGRYLHVASGGQMSGTMWDEHREWIPWWRWNLSRFDKHFVTVAEGRESTPENAKAAADVAALSRGCILEESDGWLVPLPDGGIGFYPREMR